jgi:catechol 2,3-dioxygenase-like lactoylglutathione lyase family enzyme
MSLALVSVAIVVPDYDEAIDYYSNCLHFQLVEDTPLTSDKRWVVMRPSGPGGASILLAKAADPDQADHIGNQTGGRVFLFLHCSDFDSEYQSMLGRGVHFLEPPRSEAYGKVAVFEDLYGNKWDLVQPSTEKS